MPIHPIGVKNRIGSLGSYYSVKDYYGVNPEFGTLDDFIALVDSVHAKGMYVLMDWVANLYFLGQRSNNNTSGMVY